MQIALHLGAHKTATTFIQKALEHSCDALRQNRVGYPPLDCVRPAITHRLDRAGWGLGAATGRLLNEYGDCDRVIISDENIIGGLKPPVGSRTLYARQRIRLAMVLRTLGSNPVRIYFAIRSYDEFLSALYCEYIRHNPFIDARSYLSRMTAAAFSWTDVIGRMAAAVGEENVTLWRYEDFALISDQLFHALTGGHGDLAQKPVQRLHQSMSAEAVDAVSRLEPMRNAHERSSRVKQILNALPKGPARPAYSAFHPSEAEDHRARYAEHVLQIERKFSGLTWISPRSQVGTSSMDSQ
jgi:hypothetical protein